MPISLEQWRAAVGRWVARIQRTLIIRRGVKRSPPCASNQEWESSSGQPHSGERKCMGRRKGRKKYKEDPVNDPAIASNEFCDGVIVLAEPLMSSGRTVFKDCSDGNPAGSLKELFGWTALGAFLVIMLLLLRSGDVEPNPGPAERGAHTLLSISSTPTLHELDKLTVSHAASQWEAVAPHLVVESCGICKVGSGHLEEASRGALSRWLKGESDTDIAEKTRCSVLEAHEANRSIHIAEQLKLFEESSGEAVTGHASPPGVFGTGRRHQYMSPTTTAGPHVRGHPPGDLAHAASVHTPFGSNEIHGPDGKLGQQGAHTLLSISSTPALHELNKLTVDHAASQWEEVAPHLVVESCGVCNIIGSGHLEEASREALSRWLKGESGTDIAEKTRCSVLEAQEASGNIPLAEQLKLFEESSGEAVTSLASLPERSVHTPFGSNEIHGPDGKLTQQGAHTLLSISSTPTLHEPGKLTVGHEASQWEEVAPHLVVESCGICNIIGSGHLEEESRGALSRWLKGESDTQFAKKTMCSVLEPQEANGNIPLAEQLKFFEESSGEPVTSLASPPSAYTLLSINSTPTLHELDKLTVGHVTSQRDEVAPHFVVESCGVCKFGSGHLQEASREALSRWLKGESDTDIAEKTKCSDLEAQDASGNIPLAEQLKLFEESSGEPVTGRASPPGPAHNAFSDNEIHDPDNKLVHQVVFGAGRRQEYISPPTGATPHVRGLPSGDIGYAGPSHTHLDDNEIHGPDAKLVQQGADTLLSISSMPLHDPGELTVDHAASQWEEVAPHLVVESCGVCNINGSGHLQEASRGALSRWLKGESDTDIAEKTKCSDLEAQEASSRNIPLAEQLKLFEESSEEPVTGLASPPGSDHTLFHDNQIHGPDGKLAQQDPIRPSRHMRCDLLNEMPHFDLIVDCLCCHFGEWMKVGPTKSDLGCLLSDGVPVPLLSPVRSAHLLSVKSNTVFNALSRRMTALITFILCQTVLVALSFLLFFLLEVTAASLDKTKAWWKADLPSGNRDISYSCKEMCAFKSIYVQCPLNLEMRYRYRAASQQLCGLLAKPYVFLRELLLLSGDIEPNPGPFQVLEELLSEFREQFISDMDVNMIVMELLDKKIISDGVRERIEKADGPRYRSEILHEHLKRTCTEEAFRRVCAIIGSVQGNPKMSALGNHMQRSLELGVYRRGRREGMTPLLSSATPMQSQLTMGHASGITSHVEREGEEPDVGLTLTIRKNSAKFQMFFAKMQSHYARMKVVDDRWRKCQSMEFVKLALSRFKLDFENEQKKFVDAVSDPEGVDKVYHTVMKDKKIRYQDIPTMVKKSKLVIISGAPGVGKSTLAKKLCQDISKQINDHKYELVLLVELRDLIAFKDLEEPFELHHLLQLFSSTKSDAADLAQEMIANGGRDVLLILDGYDELLHELRKSPFFLHLLMHSPRSPLPECDVVLTSRSIATSQIYMHFDTSGTACNFVNVEVLGFTTAQIKLYAKQYFTEEEKPGLANSFTERIAMLPQIKSLCAIPIVLSIICRVYLKDEQLPSTLSSVYERFVIDKLLINSDSKDRRGSLQSLLDLPQDHTFYHLCEIAFLYVKEQKVIFSLDDDQAEANSSPAAFTDRGHGYGLLTARPVNEFGFAVVAVDSFYYIHLTVQEYLSALHIARQDIALQKEIWAEYLGQPHMAQVWRFFCGITGLANFDALHLTSKVEDNEFLVQSLYESQNGVVTGVAMQTAFGDIPCVTPRNPYSAFAYGYCLQHHKNMKKLVIYCARSVRIHLGNLLSPVLQTASSLHLSLKNCHPKDLQDANDALKCIAEEQNPALDSMTGHPVPRSVDKVTLSLTKFPLDVLCDVVPFCEHVNELECVGLKDPKQSLSLDLLNKMSTSLAQNKTMVKLNLYSYEDSPEGSKLLIRHLLLGLRGNDALTDLTLRLPHRCWDWPEGNLVQTSVERVSLIWIPLDFVCEALGFFGHVKELECTDIKNPQQSGVAEDGPKLEELEGKLAGHESLKKLRFHFWYEAVPQTLVQKFGVAAVRGVARNKSIAEFKLEPCKRDPQVVDGMLVKLTADERRKFRVGKDYEDCPFIELCPVGDDPSSGGAPPSTDSQPIGEDTVMDLDRTEHPNPTMMGMIPEEEEEEESPSPAKKIRKLQNDDEEHPTSAMTGMIPEEEEEESPSLAKKIRKLQNDKEEGDGTGVSEDHSTATSSSATAAVNQRDDTAVSSIYSGSSTDVDCSAPSTLPCFTQVGGVPHWGETLACTDLSYNHPQTAKYLMKATVRPKEKDPSVVRETSSPFPTEPAVGGDGEPITQGGSLSTALRYVPLDSLCWRLCNLAQAKELNCDSIIDPQQSLSLDLLNKMATLLAHNETLKRLELRSDSLTQYNDAKRFTQHLLLGAAGSTTLTEVCIGFSSWWRDCHIQSGHVAGGVQKVTMWGAPLDVLCDLLPVFEPVEQLVCLNIKDPQESNMTMAALKLNEVERVLTGCTQLTTILFECCWLQSTPELFFSLCISSLLKGAARNKNITSVQLVHSEEHQQQVEEVLTYLLTDLSVEERRRIGRGQCTLESGLVCPCIEVLPITGSGKGKRSATEGAPFLPKKGRDCSD